LINSVPEVRKAVHEASRAATLVELMPVWAKEAGVTLEEWEKFQEVAQTLKRVNREKSFAMARAAMEYREKLRAIEREYDKRVPTIPDPKINRIMAASRITWADLTTAEKARFQMQKRDMSDKDAIARLKENTLNQKRMCSFQP
jgi:hypothetical protein